MNVKEKHKTIILTVFFILGITLILLLLNSMFKSKNLNAEIIYNYKLLSSSEDTLSLSYAYISQHCMKIGFSFKNESKYNKEVFN
jgi:hypothetical protein